MTQETQSLPTTTRHFHFTPIHTHTHNHILHLYRHTNSHKHRFTYYPFPHNCITSFTTKATQSRLTLLRTLRIFPSALCQSHTHTHAHAQTQSQQQRNVLQALFDECVEDGLPAWPPALLRRLWPEPSIRNDLHSSPRRPHLPNLYTGPDRQ